MRSHELAKYSLRSLVGIALQDWGSDLSWGAIYALQMRGSPDALALATGLASSRNWRKRALGMYIASQLRQPNKGVSSGSSEYALAETQALLLSGLKDPKEDVAIAAISGFGHRPHPLALPVLLTFATHNNEDVRFRVSLALGNYSQDESVEALLLLAEDVSEHVRDWATFSLGTILDIDNSRIRERLWQNLQDTDANVAGEALAGLAARKDERIIPILLERLNGECRVYDLDAAEQMACPALLPRLIATKESVSDPDQIDSYWYSRLEGAITACGAPRIVDTHPVFRE
jgi:HEAT repeat protein